MKKLRILVHQPRFSYYVGGGETIPLYQAHSLSKLGNTVEILTSNPPKFSKVFDDFRKENPQIKINLIDVPKKYSGYFSVEPEHDWSRWDEEAMLFGHSAEKFYIDNIGKWDLVITHLLSDSLFIPDQFKNITRLHGVPAEFRNFDRIFLKRPDGFVPDCESVRNGWRNLYPELKDINMPIAYNGVDSTLFNDNKQERDIDFLYVGRFIQIKGVFDILNATKILVRKGVKFNKLMLVGHGPLKEEFEKFINNNGLEEKVEIVDQKSQLELVGIYNRAKIFLGPSYAYEGVISTMLEAAASGAAVITANAAGMPEYAKHRTNSLVIEPQNYKQLAEYMEELLTNQSLRNRLRSQARLDIENNWDLKVTNKRLNEIYHGYVKK